MKEFKFFDLEFGGEISTKRKYLYRLSEDYKYQQISFNEVKEMLEGGKRLKLDFKFEVRIPAPLCDDTDIYILLSKLK